MLNSLPVFDNIDFKGGNLSSDGGSILLLQFLRKTKISDQCSMIPFNDDRLFPVYSNADIMAQLTARTLLGYFNQADQNVLMEDPLLSKFFRACSQPTVSRFFDRVTNQTNLILREQLIEMACKYINQNVADPIIDNSTLLETYENQEASAYIHHYSETGYHPLFENVLWIIINHPRSLKILIPAWGNLPQVQVIRIFISKLFNRHRNGIRYRSYHAERV